MAGLPAKDKEKKMDADKMDKVVFWVCVVIWFIVIYLVNVEGL